MGIDAAEAFLEVARRQTKDSRVTFMKGDAAAIPAEDAPFMSPFPVSSSTSLPTRRRLANFVYSVVDETYADRALKDGGEHAIVGGKNDGQGSSRATVKGAGCRPSARGGVAPRPASHGAKPSVQGRVDPVRRFALLWAAW